MIQISESRLLRLRTIYGPDFPAHVRAEAADLGNGLFAISRDRWRVLCRQHRQHSRPFGLGDAVAAVAQPIARALDAVAGTSLAGCQPCKQRRAALNKALPNLKRPLG